MEKVRLAGDPVLTTPCVPVDPFVIPNYWPLIDQMIETMNAERGMGLAANQIGHSLRIFIMKNEDGTISEFINPCLISGVQLVDFEGEACLSIPGVSVTTKRYNEVALSWIDKHGVLRSGVFKGLRAFAVQHEMDHLAGKLYLDQFGPVKRSMVLKKHKKFLKVKNRS